MRVIFVCSGNICRSPMAERLFTAALRRDGRRGAAVSMSTLGIQGRRAASNAVEALAEVGIDLSDHRSQALSAGLLRASDRVFVMEHAHRDAVARLDPGLRRKVVLLGKLDPEGGEEEIDDPVGQEIEMFRACRDRLSRCIEAWLATQEHR